jgi:hypothetical protein
MSSWAEASSVGPTLAAALSLLQISTWFLAGSHPMGGEDQGKLATKSDPLRPAQFHALAAEA